MSDFSRRWFLKGSAAIPFGLWMEKYAVAQKVHPRIRYNVMSTHGQTMLAIYKKAVAKMMATSTANPRSWNFQWYTHWVPPNFDPQTKVNMITNTYDSPPLPPPPPSAAWKSLAQDMWDTCQAHGPGEDENYFLPWHRMYVFWLESIVRKVSGKAEFTLPYWNYSAASAISGPRLPKPFILPGATTNPLWRANRNAGSNAGNPIDQGQPDTPLSTSALDQCTYEPNGAQQGFCMGLDFGLHGNVHVLVGNGQGMGNVPTAAGDPIFWMHHCNIDRLWASWNHGPNARPNPTDPTWLNQTFTFADENGIKVVGKVGDVDSIAKLHYEYDAYEALKPCRTIRHIPNLIEAIPPLMIAGPGPVELGAAPVRIPLTVQQTGAAQSKSLLQHFEALTPQEEIFLVLRKLQAEVQPGVLYNIYLNLPEGAAPEKQPELLLGAVNFFESMPHADHAEGPTPRFYSFELSQVLSKLKAAGHPQSGETTVTIVPAGKPGGEAKPIIGQITVVKQ